MRDSVDTAAEDAGEGFEHALAARLRAHGALDDDALNRALRVGLETGARLDRILPQLGLVDEVRVAAAVAEVAEAPLADEDGLDAEVCAALLEALGARFAENARVAPVGEAGDAVRLGMVDPFDDAVAHAVALKLGRPVARAVLAPGACERILARLTQPGSDGGLDGTDNDGSDDVARLKSLASEAPVVRLVNAMIRRAAEAGASDIHIEPMERSLRVRFRVDGALREAEAPPHKLRAAIVSRIKIMARLDIAETRRPQDGRVKTVALGRPLDLRVATSPTLHGESVVIRILDRAGLTLDFEALGLEPRDARDLAALTDRPNGVVLVTGPTGSGKTTTLYAALNRINAVERKIVTVEDPVEYQLEGVAQIQVDSRIGLGFAEALRSILRQDPDVIMIGEIRDLETARIAVQAALTGHLVLATLHTNSAAAAVHRLRDMGVPSYLLAATLAGCVAQRLVRLLCPDCAASDPSAAALASGLAADDASVAQGGYRDAAGCPACAGVGRKGRTSVMEVMRVDDDLRDLIAADADERALTAAARGRGMRSLRDHALARAASGQIAVAEVARVAADL